MTYPKHAAALAWARRERDDGVHEVPMGSNTGPRVLTYQRQTWLGGTRWPWCVAFAISAWQLGANRQLPYRGAGAYAYLAWAQKNGWAVPLDKAVPGDMVVFNVGSGHMALLAKPVSETGPNVVTIDGNVSDRVADRVRPRSTVRGCVHIPEAAVKDPTPPPPPRFEVVRSESGRTKVIYASGPKAIGLKLPKILARYPSGVKIRRKKP